MFHLVCLLLLPSRCQLLLCMLSIMSQFYVYQDCLYSVPFAGYHYLLCDAIFRDTRCHGRKGTAICSYLAAGRCILLVNMIWSWDIPIIVNIDHRSRLCLSVYKINVFNKCHNNPQPGGLWLFLLCYKVALIFKVLKKVWKMSYNLFF